MTSMEEELFQKYQITEIQHPQYPELKRIKALRNIEYGCVWAGTLGGYVEHAHNLSQEGDCWIADEAICRGNARVTENARMMKFSKAEDEVILTGKAVLTGHSIAKGNAYIENAYVRDNAQILSGAVVKPDFEGGYAPVISTNAVIEGTVSGWFVVEDTKINAGEILKNGRKEELIAVEYGKYRIVEGGELQPAQKHQKSKERKDKQPER